MIKCIVYGSEQKDKFYVQSCCGEEHVGQSCDCKSHGENLNESDAQELANKMVGKQKR